MYKHDARQISLTDHKPEMFGGIELNPNNRWVVLSKVIPWAAVEAKYKKNFKRRGQDPLPARLALGVLLIRAKLNLSDRETIEALKENPYLQYFVGYSEYRYDIKLDPSMLTYFRKRLPADVVAYANDLIIKAGQKISSDTKDKSEDDDKEDNDDDDLPSGGCSNSAKSVPEEKDPQGTLILDATCAPQDIQYPTDVRLLAEARKALESMQDTLQKGRIEKKPRNYRRKAKREYNQFCRNRRPGKKTIRKALRGQLQYVRRDLKIVDKMLADSSAKLSSKQERYLETIRKLYAQQKEMYKNKSHRCENRIVSLHQPHVRPIVRGKQTASVEFGSKLTVGIVNGYCRVERLSWDAYNESGDLEKAVESYKKLNGFYPKRILCDQIFRTRKNRRYCKERGIHMNGRPLGRPPKDQSVYEAQKSQEREESGERNAIEGKFGEGKRKYSLGCISTRLKETSETEIHLIFMVMNLKKILRDLFAPIFTVLFYIYFNFKMLFEKQEQSGLLVAG